MLSCIRYFVIHLEYYTFPVSSFACFYNSSANTLLHFLLFKNVETSFFYVVPVDLALVYHWNLGLTLSKCISHLITQTKPHFELFKNLHCLLIYTKQSFMRYILDKFMKHQNFRKVLILSLIHI